MADTPHGAGQNSQRHEDYAVPLRPVIIFGGILLTVTLVVLLLMGWLFDVFTAQPLLSDIPTALLEETRQPPPEPRLQVTPARELEQMRAAAAATLHSYGWVDRAAGIVRIPVDRAMDLLTERGLQSRKQRRGSRP